MAIADGVKFENQEEEIEESKINLDKVVFDSDDSDYDEENDSDSDSDSDDSEEKKPKKKEQN
jgi:hypothetical protein